MYWVFIKYNVLALKLLQRFQSIPVGQEVAYRIGQHSNGSDVHVMLIYSNNEAANKCEIW